jgi:uncharacterized damage-inducible protein DinB
MHFAKRRITRPAVAGSTSHGCELMRALHGIGKCVLVLYCGAENNPPIRGHAMADSEILKTMARYNQWANRDLFAAVRTLPAGEATKQRPSLFKNIINTLNHPLVVDRMWWAHLHRQSHPHRALNEILYEDFEELAAAREEMDQRLIHYVDALSGRDAGEEVDFTLLSGATGRMNRRLILMHMFNHNTYHRGFVVETFCQVPAPLPLIDLPIFMRGGGGMRFMPPHLQAAA